MWRDDHVEEVAGRFGLVCVSRGGLQPERAVHESDTLSRHCQNIFLVTEWVRNETSATEVRRALRRGLSVKYLIPDSVIEYIHQHNLYTEDSERRNKDTVLRPLTKQAQQPVKSLDDWQVEGYSIKMRMGAPGLWIDSQISASLQGLGALLPSTGLQCDRGLHNLQMSAKEHHLFLASLVFSQKHLHCAVVSFKSYTWRVAHTEPRLCATMWMDICLQKVFILCKFYTLHMIAELDTLK